MRAVTQKTDNRINDRALGSESSLHSDVLCVRPSTPVTLEQDGFMPISWNTDNVELRSAGRYPAHGQSRRRRMVVHRCQQHRHR